MTKKLDITSSTLEKGLEVAKDFLDKLIMPATEEIGLLIRDRVSLWRMKNQVAVATKAKAYCEANGIEPSRVSPKLLLPLMEGAALEDDEVLQDKWAILLSNLVDSDQNIQNHVFPYILGQISSDEFLVLENVFRDMRARIRSLESELQAHLGGYQDAEARIKAEIELLDLKIKEARAEGVRPHDSKVWGLQSEKREKESEGWSLKWRERSLRSQMEKPEQVPEDSLQEFELSNLTRLGLVRHVQETYAERQTLDIPDMDYQRSIDLEIEVVSDERYILTELGVLFVKACTEKRAT